ncbi:MAG: four helix bundle protein [Gammaproteobacteria bacterium]|nr:four helix bundle protein [Gammaproteobacteria bacterium]
MRIHKDLVVWKQSIALAVEVYKLTATFPKQETYGLGQQMRRAAVSVASNIGEGAARGSKKEFIRFLRIAAGSLSELDTQMEIADAIGMGDIEQRLGVRLKSDIVARMLSGLIRSMARRNPVAHEVREGSHAAGYLSPVTSH